MLTIRSIFALGVSAAVVILRTTARGQYLADLVCEAVCIPAVRDTHAPASSIVHHTVLVRQAGNVGTVTGVKGLYLCGSRGICRVVSVL